MVLVLLVLGALLLVWPGGAIRLAHALRPALPKESATAAGAARIAGVLLIVASLLLALAEG